MRVASEMGAGHLGNVVLYGSTFTMGHNDTFQRFIVQAHLRQ
jgi:hypothetical protein